MQQNTKSLHDFLLRPYPNSSSDQHTTNGLCRCCAWNASTCKSYAKVPSFQRPMNGQRCCAPRGSRCADRLNCVSTAYERPTLFRRRLTEPVYRVTRVSTAYERPALLRLPFQKHCILQALKLFLQSWLVLSNIFALLVRGGGDRLYRKPLEANELRILQSIGLCKSLDSVAALCHELTKHAFLSSTNDKRCSACW